MSSQKSNSAKVKRFLTSTSLPNEGENPAVQLRVEIDRLALLLEQVKKQSDQVQAAADAIGHKFQLDTEFEPKTDGHFAGECKPTPPNTRSRQSKLFRFSATSQESANPSA